MSRANGYPAAVTKQHFEAVAAIFNEHLRNITHRYEHGTLLALACDLADLYAKTNSNFNRTKFLLACGKEGAAKRGDVTATVNDPGDGPGYQYDFGPEPDNKGA